MRRVIPSPAYAALQRVRQRRRIKGRPFPFLVAKPHEGDALNCCIAFNEYGAYCVPVSGLHRPAARHILAGDVWEHRTLAFLASHYTGGDIVHAGTFFGDFLPPLSQLAADGALLWAFEPNPESHRCAGITIELNRLKNVRLTNAGLGDASGSGLLATADFSGMPLGGASRMMPTAQDAWDARGSVGTEVPLVTIDESVPEDRTVSVIQLDVEHYEQRALTGGLRIIRRHRPILIVETVPEEAWLQQHLTPLGYRVVDRFHENVVFACR